jgi:CNT family concentrative nucleoside transporter
MTGQNLTSILGAISLLGVAWILSSNRRRMNWRVIGWGLGLQLAFAVFVFRASAGNVLFLAINDVTVQVLGTATAGVEFVFGSLAIPPGKPGSVGFVLATQYLPTIVFFSALMAVLYYANIMPRIVRGFSILFTKLMRISGAESLCAASNIFVGIESALTIKPHLNEMTRSEFCTILAAGMATVASSVMAVYVGILEPMFDTIAGHLISASLLSAPAAIVMSKIILPEDGKPVTLGVEAAPHYERDPGFFVALINGANSGVKLVVGVAGLLLAVLSFIALLDLALDVVGKPVNDWLGIHVEWTVSGLLGYLFAPFTAALGVAPEDVFVVSKLIGLRAVATEIPAYAGLAAALENGVICRRSAVIATYALCGFAHVASMAIFVGGVSSLAPRRTADIARVGFRALLAATLACLLTACVAGAFYTPGTRSVLLGG